jgi:hypothetical protein
LPFRVIAGHDTTAGFLNFYLYKDNPVFNAYISLAPEMAPEMESRVADRLSKLTKPIFYYQATGESDLSEINEKAAELDTNIKAIPNPKFSYLNDAFKGASHYSLVVKAIPNALYFIFDGYQPISMIEFQQKIMPLEAGYTDYLIKKYTDLNAKLGLQIKPRLSDFKAIEAAILKNNAFAEFEQLASLSKKSYPKSMLHQYHMGMFYEKTGDTKKASKAYLTGYNMEEIGSLTKDFMLEKSEQLK